MRYMPCSKIANPRIIIMKTERPFVQTKIVKYFQYIWIESSRTTQNNNDSTLHIEKGYCISFVINNNKHRGDMNTWCGLRWIVWLRHQDPVGKFDTLWKFINTSKTIKYYVNEKDVDSVSDLFITYLERCRWSSLVILQIINKSAST
jgi:hypothetical protein